MNASARPSGRLGQVVRRCRSRRSSGRARSTSRPRARCGRLGVPNDRVGPEVGQVLGLLGGRHVRKRPDRSRAARAALVEEQQPVVLERALPPGVVDQLEQARRLEPGAALEVDQPRQVVVLAPGVTTSRAKTVISAPPGCAWSSGSSNSCSVKTRFGARYVATCTPPFSYVAARLEGAADDMAPERLPARVAQRRQRLEQRPVGFANRFGTKTVNGPRRSRFSRCPSR